MKRKKNYASLQLTKCYSADELQSYHTGGLTKNKRSRIFYHLNIENCSRCRDLLEIVGPGSPPREIHQVSQRILERLKKNETALMELPAPIRIKKGQVWTTFPELKYLPAEDPDDPGIYPAVLVIWAGTERRDLDNIIRVIPISFDTEYEMEGETVVLDEGSPLGFPVLLEIFNETPMLAGHLDRFLGNVQPDDMARVMTCRNRFLEGEIEQPDEEYRRWKEIEIELVRYLSLPVKEYLLEESEEEKQVEIYLEPYSKAAGTSDIDLSDVSEHVLLKTEKVTAGVVQVKERVLLRIAGKDLDRESIRVVIDGNEVALQEKFPGVYEIELGIKGSMPAKVGVAIEISNEKNEFQLIFRVMGT